LVEQGSPKQLMASQKAWTHQFMHGESDGPVPFHLPAPSLASDFLGEAE
jgi:phospholipid/cholesterol/gamma-HCH transport system ATP-binding protein